MTEEKPKPKFWIDFNSFADYGLSVEAVLTISPDYDIISVVSMQHGSETARAVTLVFRRKETPLGRRGYSLKQEWEQLPNGQSSVLDTNPTEKPT